MKGEQLNHRILIHRKNIQLIAIEVHRKSFVIIFEARCLQETQVKT